MNKPKYLYGAAIQGIQNFIFQTNTLKEIAGASELVEQICTSLFAKEIGITVEELSEDDHAIVTAAGNIKYVFRDEKKCAELVRTFPKKVMEFAPGITISQAVVKVVKDEIEKCDIDQLEIRLRIQRNKPVRPFIIGLMATRRSQHTGLPAVTRERGEYLDQGTVRKCQAIHDEQLETGKLQRYGRVFHALCGKTFIGEATLDFSKITKSNAKSYSWLAVIHADGNNMGIALQKLSEAIKDSKDISYSKLLRQFSLALDTSTKKAAQKAFNDIIRRIRKGTEDIIIPFRPIVIGGDDLTVVCRGDLAIEFTKLFLKYFEEETTLSFSELPINVEFLKKGLTACAGIAYIKENYPFHYGYQLAEILCSEAKKAAKKGLNGSVTTPSCLMFHKVQASFIEDYKTIKKRELQAGNIFFDYGPYYLENNGKKPTVENLEGCVEILNDKEGNIIKSHLRQWLTDLNNEPGLAIQKLDRLSSTVSESVQKKLNRLNIPNSAIENNKSPIYDWLTIHSINKGGA